jgi:two-component system, chemotaxis family, CheB/CheR fusion protein
MEGETPVLDPEELGKLLEFIHRSRGFDFSGYKRASLQRRLSKRMREVGVATPADYQDYLEVNPHEFAELFDTILINVTSFFRDPAAWAYLAEEAIPPLLASGTDPIRVWCAGCATGEEAYTVAIVLAEALGENQFKERVKIYATDADEGALQHARQATYSPQALKGVPQELLTRYFEEGPQDYSFLPDLRRSVIFGRNDLVQDPTISHVDLLVCRNVLMYFTPDTQSHILQRFGFSLSERGLLFLGRSEMLSAHRDLFAPYNLKWRIFQKVSRTQARERLAFGGSAVNPTLGGDPGRYLELRQGAFALSPHAQIVVSREGFVVDVNQRLRELFGCTLADIGCPFQDLALSYRPVDLRTALERAYDTGETITLGRVPWSVEGGEERVLEIEVRAVPGPDGVPLGACISFIDITVLSRLVDEHDERERELEKAHEELQSTVEELETTNEELQSSNEEMETTNEELQFSNEELETSNEELRSSNEELETLNRRQLERSQELDRANLFLEGILANLGVGVVVLDASHHVEIWNGQSTELWGLRAEEVEGKTFSALDIGLPVDKVEGALRLALGSEARASSLELDAVNRRGRGFKCSVRVLPLPTPEGEVAGVLLLMADRSIAEVSSFLLAE